MTGNIDIRKVAKRAPFAVLEKPAEKRAGADRERAPSAVGAGRARDWQPLQNRLRAFSEKTERAVLILAAVSLLLLFGAKTAAAGWALWKFFVSLFLFVFISRAVLLRSPIRSSDSADGPLFSREPSVIIRQLALLAWLGTVVFFLWSAVVLMRLF